MSFLRQELLKNSDDILFADVGKILIWIPFGEADSFAY